MLTAVLHTIDFTCTIIRMIVRVASKSTFASRTCIRRICYIYITHFSMRTAMRRTIGFTGIVICVIICFAFRDLTGTIGVASARSRIARKCIAVHTFRSAMGIVIFTNQRLIRNLCLIADITIALFVDARSGGTDLFLIA